MCPLNLAVLAALDASSLQLDLDVRQMLLQVHMWPLGGGMPIESAPFAPDVWQEVANIVEEMLWPTPCVASFCLAAPVDLDPPLRHESKTSWCWI